MNLKARPDSASSGILAIFILFAICAISPRLPPAAVARAITVESLLLEMVDLENLAVRPEPSLNRPKLRATTATATIGGEAWFANRDVGQYVRTETTDNGRQEHVLADLKGPGTVTRFWSANPDRTNTTRFYFDGEVEPRLELPLADLFKGLPTPFSGPDFSYISGYGRKPLLPSPLRHIAQDHRRRAARKADQALLRDRIPDLRRRSARRDVRSGESNRLGENRDGRRRQARASRFHRAYQTLVRAAPSASRTGSPPA